nr:polyamine-modulated factor 1 [Aotus nancymaae]
MAEASSANLGRGCEEKRHEESSPESVPPGTTISRVKLLDTMVDTFLQKLVAAGSYQRFTDCYKRFYQLQPEMTQRIYDKFIAELQTSIWVSGRKPSRCCSPRAVLGAQQAAAPIIPPLQMMQSLSSHISRHFWGPPTVWALPQQPPSTSPAQSDGLGAPAGHMVTRTEAGDRKSPLALKCYKWGRVCGREEGNVGRPSGIPEKDLHSAMAPYFLQQRDTLRRHVQKQEAENRQLADAVLAGRRELEELQLQVQARQQAWQALHREQKELVAVLREPE